MELYHKIEKMGTGNDLKTSVDNESKGRLAIFFGIKQTKTS